MLSTQRKIKKNSHRNLDNFDPRSGLVYPKSRSVTLRYHQTGSFTCAAGALGSQVFRANSLYDPDYTGTGHQPLGFDQWAAFYRTYVVRRFRWTVQLLNYSAFQSIVGTILDNNATLPTGLDEMCEQAMSANTFLFAQNPPYIPPAKFSGEVDMKQWFNVKNDQDEVPRYGALVTADPANVCYFGLYGRDISAAGTVTVYYNVLFEYDAVFSEPQDLPKS